MISIYFNTDIPYHYYSTIKLSNSKKKHDIIILPISAWMKKALLFWIYPYFIIIIMIKKKLKSVYLLRLVTQCSVQSISVQLCFDSEKQRSFPTIKFTFIVIYILILLLLSYYTSAKSFYFPHPKKWQICCNQIIKAGENLFFFVLHNDQDWIYFPHLRIGKEVVIYDTLIHF